MRKTSKLSTKIYQEHLAMFGEPGATFDFKTSQNDRDLGCPSHIQVLVWEPDNELNLTRFTTIGMSDVTLDDNEHRTELHFSLIADLKPAEIDACSEFIASVALSSFKTNNKFDWWNRITTEAPVPIFSDSNQLLLHPAFVKDGWDTIESGERVVKIMNLVALTKQDSERADKDGLTDMLNHLYDNNISFFEPR